MTLYSISITPGLFSLGLQEYTLLSYGLLTEDPLMQYARVSLFYDDGWSSINKIFLRFGLKLYRIISSWP